MVKKICFTLSVLLCGNIAFAQTTTVKGIVIDSISQMPLPYAAVYFNTTTIGTLCDNAGRFSISIPNDNSPLRNIVVVLSDYKLHKKTVPGGKTAVLTVKLQPSDLQENFGAFGGKREGRRFYEMLYKAAKIVSDDYIPIGNRQTNKFDFGRVQTTASYNYLEGLRLRGGIASTSRLHPHLFVRGYAAYGFRDRKMKYRGEATWAFNNPKYHEGEYPANNLRLVHQYEVYSPGENHPHSQNDELLYSFRHAEGSMAYRRFTEINYEKEAYSGFSYIIWANTRHVTPAENLDFIRDGVSINSLKTTETGFKLRYSPHEAFRQNRRKKKRLTVNNPVFQFSYSLGLKKMLGGEYGYHRTELSAKKRFLLGAFGHIDAAAEMLNVWSKAPFPLLLYPNANPSYLIENESFSLLNAMEFINDSQYIFKTTYVANNLLLAHIPYFRDLPIREVFSIRGMYGSLSDKNNPLISNDLFKFPPDSYIMNGNAPYWEGGIGIANIVGILRLDYVFRLTYRDVPGTAKNGFRVGISL